MRFHDGDVTVRGLPPIAAAAVRTLSITGTVLLLGLSAAPVNAAEDASDPFGDAAAQKTYRNAIRDGVAEYDAHHFAEALSCFRRAHHINPNARTFRGIGMAAFELRDYVTAVRNLAAALQDQRKPLSAEQRKETQALLDRGRMFVAVYTLTTSPKNAQVTVDGNPPNFETDGTLMLGLGGHAIEARADGYQRRSLSLQVRGGERTELTLSLEQAVAAPKTSPPATVQSTVVVPAPPPPPPAGSRSGLVWFSAAGGAALLAVGAGIYWSMQSSELASCRTPPAGLRCTDESSLVRQRNIGVAATVVAAGAALTLATIGILSRRSAPPPSSPEGALACGVGPFGLHCSGSF